MKLVLLSVVVVADERNNYFIPSQLIPAFPAGHSHVYFKTPSTQVAPDAHGLERQLKSSRSEIEIPYLTI